MISEPPAPCCERMRAALEIESDDSSVFIEDGSGETWMFLGYKAEGDRLASATTRADFCPFCGADRMPRAASAGPGRAADDTDLVPHHRLPEPCCRWMGEALSFEARRTFFVCETTFETRMFLGYKVEDGRAIEAIERVDTCFFCRRNRLPKV